MVLWPLWWASPSTAAVAAGPASTPAIDSRERPRVRTVQRTLLQTVLHQCDRQVGSWVIRCPAGDADAIALLRELGFQPLRPFQVWHPPATPPAPVESLPQGLTWQPINRRNAQRLWPIEQGGCFSHLRQITDATGLTCRSPRAWLWRPDGDDAVLAGCLRLAEAWMLMCSNSSAMWPGTPVSIRPCRRCCGGFIVRPCRRAQHGPDDAPMAGLLSREGWCRGRSSR